LTAIEISNPELIIKATTALFAAMWVDLKRIGEVEVVRAVLSSAVGEQVAKEAVEGTQLKAVKDRLSRNTQEAFDAGAFGLPWFEGECR
jgi:2-hydroxychromene-2-carboxylate isomerase